MERDSSSDDDEDRENLIPQNDTKPINHRSTFDIEDLDSRLNPNPNPNPNPNSTTFISTLRQSKLRKLLNRRYIFAIFLPLFILIVYFTTDVRTMISSNISSIKFDSVGSKIRESELKALYLLKQQRTSLFNLWNRTVLDSDRLIKNPNVSSNSSKDDVVFVEDLKSAVLRQISLNKEIQDVLLSPHRSGNSSVSGDSGNDGGDLGDVGFWFDRCRKVDLKFDERKTIEWKPDSNKFLLAICLSGQMSNHLICLEKHMFFAAVLGRTLVIPSSRIDYQYNRVIDIEHINKCLGRKVVVSFEEFAEKKKHHLHINKFICYFSSPVHCYVDEDHVKKLKSLGLSMGKLGSPWVEDIKNPSKKTIQDVQSKFSTDDDVIAIGDVFFANVEQEWVMQPGGPLAHNCKTLIEPSRLILLTAQRFVQTFLGKDYIALHFRRHGFLKFCNAKKPSCFYPIPQAADCISRVVERANTPIIYLSTDAAESETGLLQALIIVNGKPVPLVKRPSRSSAEKWDALLYRHGLEEDPQVEAMLDKSISAMSSVFIGALGSTFTEDILRLRRGWGSASVCDEYLCQGEEPSFIADNE